MNFLKFLIPLIFICNSTFAENFTTILPERNEKPPKLSCMEINSNLSCNVKEFNFTSKDSIALPNADELKKFSKAKVLKFEASNLPEIPLELAKIFNDVEMLDIKAVNLLEINREVMKNFPKLKIFEASDNKLKLITKDVFQENPDLEEIHLENNEIVVMKTNSLRSRPKLKVLHLKGNKCIDENFDELDSDERKRQKVMNLVMVKCKSVEKKREDASGLLEKIIPKVSVNAIKGFGFK